MIVGERFRVDHRRVDIDLATERRLIGLYIAFVLGFSPWDTLRGTRGDVRSVLSYLRTHVLAGHVISSRHGLSFAVVLPFGSDVAYLAWLTSFPRWRGRGSRLLAEVVRRADEEQRQVVLDCPVERVPWYESHGFRAVERVLPDHQDTEPLVTMRRTRAA